MVSYEDVSSAIEWLTAAFGFREIGQRFTDGTGRVTHAELDLDGAHVMLGWPGPKYQDPAHHAEECEVSRTWLDVPWVVNGVLVYVDDLDAHHERARSAGARILRDPETIPVGRLYTAADPWDHRWMFMQMPATREQAVRTTG